MSTAAIIRPGGDLAQAGGDVQETGRCGPAQRSRKQVGCNQQKLGVLKCQIGVYFEPGGSEFPKEQELP